MKEMRKRGLLDDLDVSDEIKAGYLIRSFPDEDDEKLIGVRIYGFDGELKVLKERLAQELEKLLQ